MPPTHPLGSSDRCSPIGFVAPLPQCLLHCKGTVAPHALRKALEKVPEVVGACTVSGAADALVHLLA